MIKEINKLFNKWLCCPHFHHLATIETIPNEKNDINCGQGINFGAHIIIFLLFYRIEGTHYSLSFIVAFLSFDQLVSKLSHILIYEEFFNFFLTFLFISLISRQNLLV